MSDERKKTVCPISRKHFKETSRSVEVVTNGVPMIAEVKEFSTGSLGWYMNGKTTIKVGGVPVSVQIGMNLTIVGSKELPAVSAAPVQAPEVVEDDEPEAEPEPMLPPAKGKARNVLATAGAM